MRVHPIWAGQAPAVSGLLPLLGTKTGEALRGNGSQVASKSDVLLLPQPAPILIYERGAGRARLPRALSDVAQQILVRQIHHEQALHPSHLCDCHSLDGTGAFSYQVQAISALPGGTRHPEDLRVPCRHIQALSLLPRGRSLRHQHRKMPEAACRRLIVRDDAGAVDLLPHPQQDAGC
jgi:hypothetical protein